jgi:hypothetical protein
MQIAMTAFAAEHGAGGARLSIPSDFLVNGAWRCGLRVEPQDAFGVAVRHSCLIGRGEWRGAHELGRLRG